jgi:hypothetical protein
MKKNRILGLPVKVFIFFSYFLSIVKVGAAETWKNRADTIPFRLTSYNNIVIDAIINERDTVSLMFHTASSGITLTEKTAERLRTVQWQDSATDVTSWGGSGKSVNSIYNKIQFGKIVVDSVMIWQNQRSGHFTDGKFGPDLFESYYICLNFDRNTIILQKEKPQYLSEYTKHSAVSNRGDMFLNATCEIDSISYSKVFLIHTGYGGEVLLDDAFTTLHDIGNKIEIIEENELKDAYGNILLVNNGILPTFIIGEHRLNQIEVGFFKGTVGHQSMSVLGTGTLKKFHVIFSPKRDLVYLKLNTPIALAK